MAKKIDPLNKKHISPVAASLCVTDVKAAAAYSRKGSPSPKKSSAG